MSHLKIEQNTSSVEVISSTIIDKLYELAQSGTLDSSSNLKGNLQVAHAYEDAVTYLTTNYANLQINVTGGAYIRFADSAVASICAANWGDGTGITTIQAAVVTTFSDKFESNSSIKTFSEFNKFTNAKLELTNTTFGDSTIESINLSNITRIGTLGNHYSWPFYNCTKLNFVVFSDNCEALGYYAFYNCTLFNIVLPTSIKYLCTGCMMNTAYSHDLNLPNLCDLPQSLMANGTIEDYLDGWFSNTKIQNVTSLGQITRLSCNDENYHQGCFEGCSLLKRVILPETLLAIGSRTFCNCNSLIWIKCLAITPPTVQSSLWFLNVRAQFKIYVPDASVDVYKATNYWSTYAGRIFSLTQFAIDFPNG